MGRSMAQQGSRKWLLWVTWILSAPGICNGVYILFYSQWEVGKRADFGTPAGATAFGRFLLVYVLAAASIYTIPVATLFLLLLCLSNVPRRLKISGSIAVALGWLWLPLLRLIH